MSGTVGSLLRELRSSLVGIYHDRLKGVFLFGSYARGEETPESDVDVLVVLDHVGHYAAEVDRCSDVASALSLRHGVSISTVFISERDWARGETPFVSSVRNEALPA